MGGGGKTKNDCAGGHQRQFTAALLAPRPVIGPTHLPKLLEQGHSYEYTSMLFGLDGKGMGM